MAQSPHSESAPSAPLRRPGACHSVAPRVSQPGSPWRGRVALLRLTLASLLALTLAAGASLGAVASAQSLAASQPGQSALALAAQRAAASTSHITIIVLDMSGSMSSSDPNGLRCSAANAYIDLSGPGDFIGVVGLDNSNGATGGPHNFQRAQVWQQPIEMSTLVARQGLRATIAQQSHNCAPDSATPTYDALNQALTMLGAATHNGHLGGSVILLTDGAPYPDTNNQISAIQTDLIPQFKQHNWPIDTVALGSDTTFRSFLSDLANATSGKAYDDAKGVVAGTSPLNIAPFFVDIFARRNGRTPGPTIAPTTLNGGTTSANFQLGDYATHLDVIVVKDTPATTVTLNAPNRQQITQNIAGAFLSTDPHYAIFSIDGPLAGYWQVNVTGGGQFLVDSLVASQLAVSLVAPAASSPVLPLGQPFTVAASIVNGSTPISGAAFTVQGTISYVGGATNGSVPFTEQLTLSDSASPGTYTAQVTVPFSSAAGAYEIMVSASQVTSAPLGSDDRTVRLERFPTPFLLSGGHPTTATTTATVVRWDPLLQAIYGAPVGFLQWLGQWPLGGRPAHEDANISGQVELNGQPYTDATVAGSATLNGGSGSVPIRIVNNGGGQFQVQFSAPQDGVYTIHFQTAGAFKDSHGDFGATTRTAQLSVVGATLTEEIIAWAYTLLYLVIIALIVLTIRFALTPTPGGRYQTATAATANASMPATSRALKTTRGFLPAFLARNIVPSKAAFGKTGAELRFGYGGAVEARRQGSGAESWFDDAGRPLSGQFRSVKGLTYSPAKSPENDSRAEIYTFEKGRGGKPARLGAPQGGAAQDDARRPNRQRDNRRVRGGGGRSGGGNRGGSGNRSGRTYNDVI